MNYCVITDTLEKYETATDVRLYLQSWLMKYVGKTDGVIVEREALNGTDKSYEGLIRKAHANVYKRLRFILHGNVVYLLSSTGERVMVWGEEADKFFAGFTALTPVTFNVLENKCALLLSDLKNGDSATRLSAYYALRKMPADQANISRLQEAMLDDYAPLSKWLDGNEINTNIAVVAGKTGSPESITFANRQYPALSGKREKLKYALLCMLAQMKTHESFSAIANLIDQSVPAASLSNRLPFLLRDSLALLNTIFPSLLRHNADTAVGLMIAGFASRLQDSGFIKIDDIRQSEAGFITLAEWMLPKYEASDRYESELHRLLQLLGEFNTSASVTCLEKYLQVQSPYIKEEVAVMLLSHDHRVDEKIKDSIAADLRTRALFYQALKDIKKESYFPASFLNQKSFAEADIFRVAEDNDLEAPTIRFIVKKKFEVAGERKAYYLYKVLSSDSSDNSVYLGVAGGYDSVGTSLEPATTQTGIFWKEPFDESRIEDQFFTYIHEYLEKEKNE